MEATHTFYAILFLAGSEAKVQGMSALRRGRNSEEFDNYL